MSLDCFGKVIPVAAREELDACVPFGQAARLVFGEVDLEDIATISKLGGPKQVGLTFHMVSGDGNSSATSLWLEASEVANRFLESERSILDVDYSDAIKATTLGGFVWNLLNCRKIRYGALALVDGGIGTVHQGSAQECWNHFLKIIAGPWDCHDNPLYIWPKGENEG